MLHREGSQDTEHPQATPQYPREEEGEAEEKRESLRAPYITYSSPFFQPYQAVLYYITSLSLN